MLLCFCTLLNEIRLYIQVFYDMLVGCIDTYALTCICTKGILDINIMLIYQIYWNITRIYSFQLLTFRSPAGCREDSNLDSLFVGFVPDRIICMFS